MATGVPKNSTNKKRRGKPGRPGLQAPILHYAGKQTRQDVLTCRPKTRIERVWSNTSEATNRLFFADNADVLASLADDPTVRGHVRLVYIDPPFATQTVFHSRKLQHAYEDVTRGSEYVESLRQRLILLHELLAADGSMYLHLDEKMLFHMKIALDEIFGPESYRNCIVRKKCNPKNYTRRQYGNVADFILFYSKSDQWVWNRPYEGWTEGRDKEYQYVEAATGRRFMKVPVHAPGVRRGETGEPWRGMLPPPGKHWQFQPRVLDEFDKRGEIYWSASGNPRRKVYLDQRPGVGVQDIWMDFRDAHNQNICITGYPTEKNPELLRRIVEASSNPGDLVLDCYAGSGTTLSVAQQLGRRWIGVDSSPEALRTTLERFACGTMPMGDFASGRRDGKKPKAHDLFSEMIDVPQALPTTGRRLSIPEFCIFAARETSRTAKQIVHGWLRMQESLSKSAPSDVAEDVKSREVVIQQVAATRKQG